ncbi:glycosyltransferase family 2 protein [Nocardioides sp. Kera G14]|uniref:glycosyltransferase family 2 protein n=1 Tax=Nocardioides sp. Kera G14 TaxID=2884264 RepID=UPI001D103777|nr:glycosyltransferase family 2 protein [Nocardioides sp. Kera G14]UDY22747.1 glycosyltransferase family 2 protein [Nocardioides sp. Kera G14]
MSGVALVLVSHDGARWLPTVLAGVAAQTRHPDRFVGVDTGSLDGSADLLRDAFGGVLALSSSTSYPEALAHGVAHVGDGAEAPDWLWLLHDDSTPAPDALETLLTAAEEFPEADILGPKLREWPSLRRLLELGITISGTGRRETGLERGEYDQGQHDEIRRVLAVNTAGMLIRRSALARLGGLDPALPIFGNDIDLGWRAARAGLTTLIVPPAVVFHAEAAHRGLRRTALTGRHTHYQERRAALYTLLANSRARSLPFQLVRTFVGSLLRLIGLLATRQVGQAFDELAALLSVYVRPGPVHAARRARREIDVAPPAQVRALLAPWWLPYRHGLDFLSDVASAVTNQAADVAERRRLAAAEADPASFAARQRSGTATLGTSEEDEDDAMLRDTGAVARFLTNPVAVVLALGVLALLVAGRTAWGTVVGGGLSPAPSGVGEWWGLVLHSWHRIGQGTAVPASPYLLPLTLLATLLGGKTGWAVSVVLIVSTPLALWGAWRLLRVVGRMLSIHGVSRWLILWGSLMWALVPVVSGAWGDGRLGAVVATAALPWLAHAALGFADPDADRRWRAGWRAGLLLALVVAFTPTAWLICALLAVVVVVVALALLRIRPDRSHWGPPSVALAVPVVLLAAWWVPALVHGAGVSLLLDAGRPPAHAVDGWHLALGRVEDLGAPWWLGLVLPLLALVALLPARTRIPVLVCWLVGAIAGLVALVLSLITLHFGATEAPVGTGFLMVLLQGAAIVAIVLGAQGALRRGLSGGPFGTRRLAAGVVGLLALVPLFGGLGWAVLGDHGAIGDTATRVVPGYMLEDSQRGPAHGVLVLRGTVDTGLRYEVVRGEGITLGQDEILALSKPPAAFNRLVRAFVSRPDADTVAELARSGIQYVVAPAPADPAVAATIDATGGLSQASTGENRAIRAWQVDAPPSAARLGGPVDWLRWLLVVVQLAGIVVVAVLAAPTMAARRTR